MLQSIRKEIRIQRNFFKNTHPQHPDSTLIQTIYFGGGTPSLMEAEDIDRLLSEIHQCFGVAESCEITLEANPDDVSPQKLCLWKQSGINRFSLGVQSFFDEDLVWMNRSHNAARALQSVFDIQAAGFSNFSADLIFGIPRQSDEQWKQNIEKMIRLQIPHLSCYALTAEPKTALYQFIKKKKYPPLDEEQSARQYEILMDMLIQAGYEHYEISNFAKPGFRSRHNSNYWKGIPYLGIGPSAHSFTGDSRRWNVSNNAMYITSIQQGIIPAETEYLTPAMQWNEYLMTSLRTMEGCDLNYILSTFGKEETEKLKIRSQKFLDMKEMILQNNYLILTRKGKLFADGIAAELFKS